MMDEYYTRFILNQDKVDYIKLLRKHRKNTKKVIRHIKLRENLKQQIKIAEGIARQENKDKLKTQNISNDWNVTDSSVNDSKI